MSVLAVYQSTCKFCEAVHAVVKQSLHITADLLASLENANQAANYEEKNELDNRVLDAKEKKYDEKINKNICVDCFSAGLQISTRGISKAMRNKLRDFSLFSLDQF